MGMHIPALQRSPTAHVRPQAPQFRLSLLTSAHAPPQLRNVPQSASQRPLRQKRPSAQRLPHMPQLLLSLAMSTQNPAQLVRPVGHTHAPAAQV